MNGQPALDIICCTENPDPAWRWIEQPLDDPRLRFTFVSGAPSSSLERRLRRVNLGRIRGSLAAVRAAKRTRAGVIVAHGATVAAWCSLFARALGVDAKVVAHAFNFTHLPGHAKRSVFAFAFRGVATFVVYSTMERELYARTFGVPLERFEVSLWGVRPPVVDSPSCPLEPGDYVCAIGGNARDYETLLEAAARLPAIPFVLVVRPESLRGLALPANVKVHVDLPLARTMNVLAHSRFMLLPLRDAETACGHVTLVAAMHLGKTYVVTDSAGVADYVHAQRDALTVPAGDAEALAAATQRLWDDPVLSRALGENGRQFATSECNEAGVVAHFQRWLERSGLLEAKRGAGLTALPLAEAANARSFSAPDSVAL